MFPKVAHGIPESGERRAKGPAAEPKGRGDGRGASRVECREMHSAEVDVPLPYQSKLADKADTKF